MKNILEAPFMVEMIRTTTNMYDHGWDERNGGNISLMLEEREVSEYLDIGNVLRTIPTGFTAPELDGKYFLVTGTGRYFKNVQYKPDANLGSNIGRKLKREMELWAGWCPTHNKILPAHIIRARELHPEAVVLVHPECLPAVVRLADHAFSTGGMLKFVKESDCREFIIGTECGILHRMRKENPTKQFYPLEPNVLCPNMKKITLEDVLMALQDLAPRIELDEETLRRARIPIDRMLEVQP